MKLQERLLGIVALILMGPLVGSGCSYTAGGGGPGFSGQGGSGQGGSGEGGVGQSVTGPSGSAGPSGSGAGGSFQGDCDGAMDSPCTVWSKSLGDASEQSAHGIAVDTMGNVYIAGTYGAGGEIPMSDINYNIFAAKLDPAGNLLWIHRFGDGDDQHATSIAVDFSGNVFIAGGFGGTVNFGSQTVTANGCQDMFIAKLDSAGNAQWISRFGDATCQFGDGIAVDASGDVLLLGTTVGDIDFGGGTLSGATSHVDVVLAKFGSSGEHMWSKRFDNAADQYAKSIAVDTSGNVIISGSLNGGGAADFGGGPLVPTPMANIFLAKFDPDGGHLWSDIFKKGELSQVAADSSDNILVLGDGFDGIDFGGGPLDDGIFVAKLDSGGNHVWSKGFGGIDAPSEAFDIAPDSAGNVLVTGVFQMPIDFGGSMLHHDGNTDVFIARFDSAGNHVWSDRFGDEKTQESWGIAADSSGHVLFAGRHHGEIDLGLGPHVSQGGYDIFVAKLRP